jgi:hypothetical protein
MGEMMMRTGTGMRRKIHYVRVGIGCVLMGALACAYPAMGGIDVQLRLRRHHGQEDQWRDSIRAESIYTYTEGTGIPNILRPQNVTDNAARNGAEVKVEGAPDGVDLTITYYVNGVEWDGDKSEQGGWGYSKELRSGSGRGGGGEDTLICWVWESTDSTPTEPFGLRVRAEANGESDEATVTFFPPPDMWARRISPTLGNPEVGKNEMVTPSGENVGENARVISRVTAAPSDRESSRYLITFHSSVAATYQLRVLNPDGAAISRYFDVPNDTDAESFRQLNRQSALTDIDDSSSPNGSITSQDGWISQEISADSTYKIVVEITPVGRRTDARDRHIIVRTAQVSGTDIVQSPVLRYDSVTVSCTSEVPPLQTRWSEK